MKDYFDEGTELHFPDLTPLIDVIFILIVFFLLTPSMRERSIDVNLPSSESGAVQIEENIVIEVDENNSIWFNGEKTDFKGIQLILEKEFQESQGSDVLVRSDRSSSFGTIVSLMDIINRSGFDSVSFSVSEDNRESIPGG
ncbi:MAG: biopolymer transporter ExbD [Spirochaetia bacterium]|nr:biopolymer transporter ExbD [Spirochaetia bacterium]